MIMTEICQYLRNWFTRAQCYGTFKIENGSIELVYDTGVSFSNIPLVPGQYYRIIGSKLNDGVHKHPDTLRDETFDGAVWTMGVPVDLEIIAQEINAWQTKYNNADSAMLSPYNSESFGGYSYTKGGNNGTGSGGLTWKDVFGNRLSPWRKI